MSITLPAFPDLVQILARGRRDSAAADIPRNRARSNVKLVVSDLASAFFFAYHKEAALNVQRRLEPSPRSQILILV